GHAAREAEHVGERVLLGLVGPEADASERGAERRVVDGDDRLETGRLVLAVDDLLVRPLAHGLEDVHGPTSGREYPPASFTRQGGASDGTPCGMTHCAPKDRPTRR